MNLPCSTIEELLSAYLDRELSADQHSEVDSHLAACPACQAELSSLQQMNSLLISVNSAAPSSRVDDLFAAKLTARQAKRLRLAPRVYHRLSWAAGLAAMLLLAFLMYGLSRQPMRQGAQTVTVLPRVPIPAPVIHQTTNKIDLLTKPAVKPVRQFVRTARSRPVRARNTTYTRVSRANIENPPVVTPILVEPEPTYATITETTETMPDNASTSHNEATLATATNPPPEIAVMAMLTETTDY